VTLGYPHAGKIMRVGKPRTLDDQTVYRSAQRILSAGEKHEAELQVFAVHAVDTLTHALLKLASGYFMRALVRTPSDWSFAVACNVHGALRLPEGRLETEMGQ